MSLRAGMPWTYAYGVRLKVCVFQILAIFNSFFKCFSNSKNILENVKNFESGEI